MVDDRYKWTALGNTTLGMLLATIDISILLIAMPDLFRGIDLDPLAPANSFYLLWMILGYLIVTSVLVVSFGRLGDLYGRVRIYTAGFAIYSAASLVLAVDWLTGPPGATYIIVFRIVQGIGAAFLLGNAAAIVTDAFPVHQRGFALGIMNVVGIGGTFLGLVLGGVLAPISWRLVFLISVPLGLLGTLWSRRRLHELSAQSREPIDWLGNATFACGLVLLMVGVTYGIQPAAGQPMGWTSPLVLGLIAAGLALLLLFVLIERSVAHPMFGLHLFRIKAFTFGAIASFLASVARGGLMFMLIIWLQGIWLPLHGVDFASTPLRAGVCILPLTLGVLVAGPISGILSDRYGARPFATGGMLGSALSFVFLIVLPTDFSYVWFALVLLLMGLSMGAFASPNRAGVMNSLPPSNRGAGGGMNQTFQNSAQVISIGVFFTLLVVGLSGMLPAALTGGLEANGVPPETAAHIGHLPPVSILFAAFLGYNPIAHLAGPHVLAHVTHAQQTVLTSRSFFPELVAGPFRHGLHAGFIFAIVACLFAAAASWQRGARFVYEERHGWHRDIGREPDAQTEPAGG